MTSLPSNYVVLSLYLFLIWLVLFIIELTKGPMQAVLLLVVMCLFFHTVISLSAFGRLILHTGTRNLACLAAFEWGWFASCEAVTTISFGLITYWRLLLQTQVQWDLDQCWIQHWKKHCCQGTMRRELVLGTLFLLYSTSLTLLRSQWVACIFADKSDGP